MMVGVIPPFSHGKPCTLIPRLRSRVAPQVGFNTLVQGFSLAIRLGMISRTECQGNTLELEQFLPKRAGEYGIAI
jgi:hypothetical protein